MVALRKDGMYERHWEKITDNVGFKVEPTEDFTFTKLLNLGLMDNLDICMEVGEAASKEYAIERSLKEMKDIWSEISFIQKDHEKAKTYILTGFDEISNNLDEHIVGTQSMQFSPFKKPFEEEIIEWNDQLKLISDILEDWGKLQANWMYLQPIFDSPDISK